MAHCRSLSALATLLLLANCCCVQPAYAYYDYHTIVVGAGAAGVGAAARLSEAWQNVLLLEAQDRIGGRVWTQDFGDGVVEVGAEWIHGTTNNPVFELARSAGVSPTLQDLAPTLRGADGGAVSALVEELVAKGVEYGNTAVGGRNQSLAEVAEQLLRDYITKKHPSVLADEELMQQVLHHVGASVAAYEAADSWRLVAADSGYEALGGHQHASWHRLGYRTLFDILLKKYNNGTGLGTVDIKLNSEVTNIAWSPTQGVTVSCGDARYTAESVIVTVSLGVLKAKHSTLFSPPLPVDKQQAIDKIAMGTSGKIIVSFEKPFWESGKMYGFLWPRPQTAALPASQRWVSDVVAASTPFGSDNTLTLWTYGDTARLVETLPEDELKEQTTALLRRFMGANVTVPEPTGLIRTTWHSNPYTRGTYTYDSVSQITSMPQARAVLGAPLGAIAGESYVVCHVNSGGVFCNNVDGGRLPRRVLFAGEATHETHYGTVHGALETGRREAERILGSSRRR